MERDVGCLLLPLRTSHLPGPAGMYLEAGLG